MAHIVVGVASQFYKYDGDVDNHGDDMDAYRRKRRPSPSVWDSGTSFKCSRNIVGRGTNQLRRGQEQMEFEMHDSIES